MDGLVGIIVVIGAFFVVGAVIAGFVGYDKAKTYESLCEQESELRQDINQMRSRILDVQREIQDIRLGANG